MAGVKTGKRVQIINGLAFLSHHSLGDDEESLPRLGQRDATPPAMEKLDLESLLQRPDLAGDRWLADVQDLGSRREAAFGRVSEPRPRWRIEE